MEMSNGEIRRSWETAADKKKQLQILAELNCTDVKTIRGILIAEGIDQRKLPRNRQHAEPEAVSLALTRVNENRSKRLDAGQQKMVSTVEAAEKVAADAMAKMRDALSSVGLRNVKPLDEAPEPVDKQLQPVFNRRPTVEPRRVHILRRMEELFRAIFAAEIDNDVPDNEWAEEFNKLWCEYYHYSLGLADEEE